MSFDTVVGLIGFAFVMSISPGPGNFLLLASGANFGFTRSVPLVLGISTGFLSMVFCIGLGLGEVLQRFPVLYTLLRFACAAYVIWLAFKIATSRSLAKDNQTKMPQPISFIQAAFLQLLNPKAWTVALVVTVSYTSLENYFTSLVVMIVLFAAVNIPSISVWAIFGSILQGVLAQGNRIAVFNIVMAIVLLASMIPMLLSTGY